MSARLWIVPAIVCCALSACASATPPRPTTPPPTEIVVDEAVVVRAAPANAQPQVQPPPSALPMPVEGTTPAFQRGLALAQPLLDAPPPSPAPDESGAYAAWLEADFKPWLQGRAQAVAEANAALGESATSSRGERVVGAALVGLVGARVHAQLLAVAPPPEVRTDEKLLLIYRNGIALGAASWLEQALTSLRDCAAHAAIATDAAFVPWLDTCQASMAALQRVQTETRAQADALARERAAEANAEGTAAGANAGTAAGANAQPVAPPPAAAVPQPPAAAAPQPPAAAVPQPPAAVPGPLPYPAAP